jgi:hypothetical protein
MSLSLSQLPSRESIAKAIARSHKTNNRTQCYLPQKYDIIFFLLSLILRPQQLRPAHNPDGFTFLTQSPAISPHSIMIINSVDILSIE